MFLRIDEGFPTHPKTLRFGRLMQNPEAPWFLLRLWSWACRSNPDGDLSEMEAYDIEQAINYRPLDGKCYRAMVEAGFIDEGPDGARAIHNWMKRTGGDIEVMEAEAHRKKIGRLHRAGKCGGTAEGCPICVREASAGCPPDVPRTNEGHPPDDPDKARQGKARQDQSSPDPVPESSHPAPGRDPGAPEPEAARCAGHDIVMAYGQERSVAMDGKVEPWRTPVSKDGKVETFAASLTPEEIRDLRPTMRLHFADLKAGKGKPDALKNPTLGCGCWMAEFTALRERLHGKTPTATAGARASPRGEPQPKPYVPGQAATSKYLEDQATCGFHRENPGLPSSLPVNWCRTCERLKKRPRTTGPTEPESIATAAGAKP